jgi:hypothetical protein
MLKSFASLTIFLVFFSVSALAAEAPATNDQSAFDSKLEPLRVIINLPWGSMGDESFEFHGSDGRSTCTIQTSAKHLSMTDGVDQYFRYAGSETGFNEKHEPLVNEVSFTNSGIFPAGPNRALIQCKGEFKNPKDVLRALQGSEFATPSWQAHSVENKSLAQKVSSALLSATKALLGVNSPQSDRSIATTSLTGDLNKSSGIDSASMPSDPSSVSIAGDASK